LLLIFSNPLLSVINKGVFNVLCLVLNELVEPKLIAENAIKRHRSRG
jgi:hypothetical protein